MKQTNTTKFPTWNRARNFMNSCGHLQCGLWTVKPTDAHPRTRVVCFMFSFCWFVLGLPWLIILQTLMNYYFPSPFLQSWYPSTPRVDFPVAGPVVPAYNVHIMTHMYLCVHALYVCWFKHLTSTRTSLSPFSFPYTSEGQVMAALELTNWLGTQAISCTPPPSWRAEIKGVSD